MKRYDRSDFIPKPGGKGAVQLDEERDFEQFRQAVQPVPDRVVAALERGVSNTDAAYLTNPNLLLDVDSGGDGLVDAVQRQSDGTIVVACRTEMPGVKAYMWDWWFSWHSYASRRYRLWHPEDHLAISIAEDRRHLATIRERWVGNTSFVDELVGGQYSRLAIRFVEPSSVGLDVDRIDQIGLAICARVTLRRERLAVGHLIHLVENTVDGCNMHSRFHLGDSESALPGVSALFNRIANTSPFRQRLLTDEAGLALLYHCAQEMNHLASILSALHAEFGNE